MTNKELTAEVLKSNMDSEAKAEIIELIYLWRENKIEEPGKLKAKRKRKIKRGHSGSEGKTGETAGEVNA